MVGRHHDALERSLRIPRGLQRSADDRVIAGVCGGLGAGLGVDPTVLRLAAVVLALANGVGAIGYVVGIALLPTASSRPHNEEELPPTAERAVAVGLITLGALLLFARLGLLLPAPLVWAAALASLGFSLVWARTEEADRTRGLLLRAVGGGVLLVVGLALLFASGGVLSRIGQLGLAVLATGVGVALLLGPLIARLLRDLSVERRERIRSEERSEMAAHLHDSVLQTLTLIQRAEAPARARTLARRQERELRAWLYDERAPDVAGAAATLSSALERLVTDVEETHDVEVDLVVVGDCAMEPRLDALVAAMREAVVNAARHSGAGEVSVYAEVAPDHVDAYVRDRGVGFDVDAVETGRLGVRESIVGRMARHGGRAEVHSTPGEGTEVALEIGRSPLTETAP
ncbi:MAG: PspC domain-containing protein [Actinomycetota bacterium]